MLKRGLFVVLALVLTLSWVPSALAFTGYGEGTSGNPYVINTCDQLFEMNDDLAGHYVLGGYIDCSSATWEHIGTISGAGFSGTFDGQGYIIQNLTVDDTNGVGLFTYINGGTITNLTLDSFDITGEGTVGALAAQADNATISQVKVTNSVVRSPYGGGGVVGILNNSTVSDSTTFNTEVTAAPGWIFAQILGGFVGLSDTNVYNRNSVNGSVDATTSGASTIVNTGGFVGIADGDVYNDNYSTVDVLGDVNVGGFVGNSISSVFNQSYASGVVNGLTNVGGYTGTSALSLLRNSFAVGSVSLASNAGGLIGRVQAIGGDVTNSTWDRTRTGRVTCVGSDGGISYGSICLSLVNESNSQPDYFYSNSTNVPLDSWDFDTVWQATSGLPVLRTAPETPAVIRVSPLPTTLRVLWEVPGSDGGSPVTGYDLKYRASGTSAYTTITGIAAISSPEYTISGLSPLTEYEVEVRTRNAIGLSPWLGFITSTTKTPISSVGFIGSTKAPTAYLNDGDDETTTEDISLAFQNQATTTKSEEKTDSTDTTENSSTPLVVAIVALAGVGGVLLVIRFLIRR